MFCVSLADLSLEQCREVARQEKLIELRLDQLPDVVGRVHELVGVGAKITIACRPSDEFESEAVCDQRKKILLDAITAGVTYVDIEVESPDAYRKQIIAHAHKHGTKVILSYHNFEATPVESELHAIRDQLFTLGADVGKISCQVLCREDAIRLLSLLSDSRQMVVVGMGALGRVTRVAAPLLGGLFTFAAYDESRRTAPGQFTRDQAREVFGVLNKLGFKGCV